MVGMSKVSKALHCNKCMYMHKCNKYMYLLNVRRVEINCTECNIFYCRHVEGVEGITL